MHFLLIHAKVCLKRALVKSCFHLKDFLYRTSQKRAWEGREERKSAKLTEHHTETRAQTGIDTDTDTNTDSDTDMDTNTDADKETVCGIGTDIHTGIDTDTPACAKASPLCAQSVLHQQD